MHVVVSHTKTRSHDYNAQSTVVTLVDQFYERNKWNMISYWLSRRIDQITCTEDESFHCTREIKNMYVVNLLGCAIFVFFTFLKTVCALIHNTRQRTTWTNKFTISSFLRPNSAHSNMKINLYTFNTHTHPMYVGMLITKNQAISARLYHRFF